MVVIVKENHTFDNYFGSFPGALGTVNVSPLRRKGCGHAASGPGLDSTRSLLYEHPCALQDWADGGMNGWDLTSGSSQNGDNLAYAQYGESGIPNYWAYAKAFTLGDHFFANVLGPSFPGHMFVLAAQAHWSTDNPPTSNVAAPFWGCDQPDAATVPTLANGTCTEADVFPCFDIPSVPDILPSGINWKFYGSNFYVLPEIWSMFDGIRPIRFGPTWATNVVNVREFDSDVSAGTLPAVTWLVDQDLADEHPGVGGVCTGENWTVDRINGLMKSPLRASTGQILFLRWTTSAVGTTTCRRRASTGATHSTHTAAWVSGFPLIVYLALRQAGVHLLRVWPSRRAFRGSLSGSSAATKTLTDLDPAAQDKNANDLFDAFDFTQTPLPRSSCRTGPARSRREGGCRGQLRRARSPGHKRRRRTPRRGLKSATTAATNAKAASGSGKAAAEVRDVGARHGRMRCSTSGMSRPPYRSSAPERGMSGPTWRMSESASRHREHSC